MSVFIKKRFKVPIYFGTLIVVITDDLKSAFEKEKVNYGNQEQLFETSTAISAHCDNLYYVFLLKEFISPRVVAHEAKHVVNFIFKDTGVKLDLDNDESECYLLGWVVERIYKVIK